MKNEVFVKINADGSRMQAGMINAIDFSEQMKAVMRNRREIQHQRQDQIDALRSTSSWVDPQRYFGIDPAQERTTMEVSHSKYKIIKPTKYCKIEVSAEDADLVQKLEAVCNRGGKYSLKSKLCFQVETFLGAEIAQIYKDNQQLAPFRSAGHVHILPENLKAIWNVIFATQSHLDNFGFSDLHTAYRDRAWSLRKKISKSLEEYNNHAG